MKRIFIIAIALITPFVMSAQANSLTKFFNKYEGKDGFTSVNISSDLFELLSSINIEGEGAQELEAAKKISKDLNGINVLVYEGGNEAIDGDQLFKEALDLVNSTSYKDLLSVKSDEDNVRILAKNTQEGIIDQMLILVGSNNEFVMVNIDGKLDLNEITKMSKTLNINGLERLEMLKDMEKKSDQE